MTAALTELVKTARSASQQGYFAGRPALEGPFPPSGAHSGRQTRRPRSPRAPRRAYASRPGPRRPQCPKKCGLDLFLAHLRRDHRDGRGQIEAKFRCRIRPGRAVLGVAQRDRGQRRRLPRRGPVRVCGAVRHVLDHLLGRRVGLHRPAAAAVHRHCCGVRWAVLPPARRPGRRGPRAAPPPPRRERCPSTCGRPRGGTRGVAT